jgi:hypothetical protein
VGEGDRRLGEKRRERKGERNRREKGREEKEPDTARIIQEEVPTVKGVHNVF